MRIDTAPHITDIRQMSDGPAFDFDSYTIARRAVVSIISSLQGHLCLTAAPAARPTVASAVGAACCPATCSVRQSHSLDRHSSPRSVLGVVCLHCHCCCRRGLPAHLRSMKSEVGQARGSLRAAGCLPDPPAPTRQLRVAFVDLQERSHQSRCQASSLRWIEELQMHRPPRPQRPPRQQ